MLSRSSFQCPFQNQFNLLWTKTFKGLKSKPKIKTNPNHKNGSRHSNFGYFRLPFAGMQYKQIFMYTIGRSIFRTIDIQKYNPPDFFSTRYIFTSFNDVFKTRPALVRELQRFSPCDRLVEPLRSPNQNHHNVKLSLRCRN